MKSLCSKSTEESYIGFSWFFASNLVINQKWATIVNSVGVTLVWGKLPITFCHNCGHAQAHLLHFCTVDSAIILPLIGQKWCRIFFNSACGTQCLLSSWIIRDLWRSHYALYDIDDTSNRPPTRRIFVSTRNGARLMIELLLNIFLFFRNWLIFGEKSETWMFLAWWKTSGKYGGWIILSFDSTWRHCSGNVNDLILETRLAKNLWYKKDWECI